VAGFTFIPQTGSRSSVGAVDGFVDIQAAALMALCLLRWTMLYIGFSPAETRVRAFVRAKDYCMTYLEVVFRYGAQPGEKELRAIDGMREVYGVRRVQFNDQERTVRVEFDASRLKADAVARLLREAGVDVRERLELA
jgi:hypothetical protein